MKFSTPKEFERAPSIQGINLGIVIIGLVNTIIAIMLLFRANFKGAFLFLCIGIVGIYVKTKTKEKGSIIFLITNFFRPKKIVQHNTVKNLLQKTNIK